MIRAIRENLLVLINPVSEPDGRDKVVDWFYQYLKGKSEFDALPRIGLWVPWANTVSQLGAIPQPGPAGGLR